MTREEIYEHIEFFAAEKSVKNEEYYSPEGQMYLVIEECQQIIRLLKYIQTKLP